MDKKANMLNASIDKIVAEVQKKGSHVTTEELAKIVKTHAAGSAAAAMASVVPGAGTVVAVGIQNAFVYSMFYRLGKSMGINLKKD